MLSSFLIKSILAGALWSFLNILLLVRLAVLLGAASSKNRSRKLALIVGAKFALLYPAGIWLLWSGAVHRMGFAIGFTVVLIGGIVVLMRPQPMKVSRA